MFCANGLIYPYKNVKEYSYTKLSSVPGPIRLLVSIAEP
jgi:hypothetical protein